MEDQKVAEQQLNKSGGVIGTITNAITKDGMLAAAFRQGATELAIALRAFPDTIHAEEPGTLLNPTQGEIADNRKLPSPSEIAADKTPHRPENGQDHGNDHQHGRGR
jgi:hypothetical protein